MAYKQDIEKILSKEKKVKHKPKTHAAKLAAAKTLATAGTKLAAKHALTTAGGTIASGAAAGAAGGVAGAAAGGGVAGTMAGIATATSVAAPPFSTIISIIPWAVAGVALGITVRGRHRKKVLSKDAGILRRYKKKYSKMSRSKRKKISLKLLRKYRAHLKKGGKKTVWPFDGNKRVRAKIGWRAKKSKIEMRLRALYAAQFRKSYKKPTKKKVTKKQANAEKKFVTSVKQLQKDSIDPRTSNFPLLAGGLVGITPKLASIQLEDKTSDSDLIERQQMLEGLRPVKRVAIPDPVLVARKMEADSKKEMERVKKSGGSNALLYGIIGISVLGVGGTFLYLRRDRDQGRVDLPPNIRH